MTGYKEVSREEFIKFIGEYDGKLTKVKTTISDPETIDIFDEEIQTRHELESFERFNAQRVAYISMERDKPWKHFIKSIIIKNCK